MGLLKSENKIKKAIQEGSVFYYPDDEFHNSIPHYYVVLNKNPLSDTLLILVFATTFDTNRFNQIDNSPYPKETYVVKTPKECSVLKKISMFDCNFVHERDIKILITKLNQNDLKICGVIERGTLLQLREGVLKSRLVAERIKKLLR